MSTFFYVKADILTESTSILTAEVPIGLQKNLP
jgi:hypothetical protein